jgi:hypothetical protein
MRKIILRLAAPAIAVATVLLLAGPASAADQGNRHATQFLKLIGATEAPGPGDPDGTGTFLSKSRIKTSTLCYFLTVRKIATPTAAHIHRAPVGSPGPIIIGLATPADGFSAGCITAVPDEQQTPDNAMVTLTFSELDAIVHESAAHYINVHNAEFPAGAIRAQYR